MVRIISIALCFFICSCAYGQKGVHYLKKLHSKNYGHWHRTMTFVQTTEFYRNDSLIRKATWFEALKLPYDLRIDLDTPAKGNFVLYKKDSVYRFQNKQLRNVNADVNPFIFFIGGMYFQPFDSVLLHLAAKGFDVNKGHETIWQNVPTYVIGRVNENDSSNAIWIDTKNLWIVRLAEKNRGQLLDAHLNNHKELSKGSTETKVKIYVNGKLVQVENYDGIQVDVPLDDALFDPLTAASAGHWFR